MSAQLEAALSYARMGWPVFPVPPGTRMSHKAAKFSDGRRWGATTDAGEIRSDWQHWQDANVGIVCGPKSGMFVVEADTVEGHGVDGVGNLARLVEQHGGLPATIEAVSPSGSVHCFFAWPEEGGISNSASQIAPGVDVRGDGGMVVAVPSVRSDGSYRWRNPPPLFDLAPCPEWLLALCRKPPRSEFNGQAAAGFAEAGPAEVAEALTHIDPDQSYDQWVHVLMALHNGFGDSGLPLAEEWSAVGAKYKPGEVADKWRSFNDSGGHTIAYVFHLARLGGCDLGALARKHRHQGAQKAAGASRSGGDKSMEAHGTDGAGPDPQPANGADQPAHDDAEPVDLWAVFPPPSLPRGILPPVIEDFAFVKGGIMGADPGGLATAALVACAAALTDAIKLQVKRHDPTWLESARLWVALIGEPSTKKSPVLDAAIRPLAIINAELRRKYAKAKEAWDKLSREEQEETDEPILRRTILGDTTIEAAQVALRDNPQGLLCHQDELAGWFGAMDKYAGNRGAQKDRGFWLTAYNGGPYAVDRISRGSSLIKNLSVCMLGGIQPGPIRALAADGHDDGLFARLCPLVIGPAGVGRDELMPDAGQVYGDLVEALHRRQPQPASMFTGCKSPVLRFDDGAQAIRQNLEAKHLDLQKSFEAINRKLAAHIGKYDGLFARLCVIWHAIESIGWEALPGTITVDVAARVERFLHGFLLPHAIAFYAGMLGLSDDHDSLAAVAGYILARRLEVVTNRDVQRGNRTMRGLKRPDVQRIFEQLEALGWLHEAPPCRVTGASHWAVNPRCHQLFRERGQYESDTRDKARSQIAESLRDAREG